ncbi:MAG: penicillin-binding transpeptidase domain-containing protein [Inquilinaceae bacterium]
MKTLWTLSLLAALAVLPAHTVYGSDTDITAIVRQAGVDPETSTLIIARLSDHYTWTSNKKRVDTPFPPASTSKIPHTLIALETGLAGVSTAFAWDGVSRPIESWNQDQTLESAYRRSAVWVYQRIAASLGAETTARWLGLFEYGNQDIGLEDDLTTYWLLGPLEISARQQIAFLERLARRDLPLSDETFRAARVIMQADAGDGWTLFAKTGWRRDGKTQDIGWYVGWVDHTGADRTETYVFAFNMDMTGGPDLAKRAETVYRVLASIGVLPADMGN